MFKSKFKTKVKETPKQQEERKRATAEEAKAKRRKAEDDLGENFDIRHFHDEVLCDGGITLPILENKIEAFIGKHKN